MLQTFVFILIRTPQMDCECNLKSDMLFFRNVREKGHKMLLPLNREKGIKTDVTLSSIERK